MKYSNASPKLGFAVDSYRQAEEKYNLTCSVCGGDYNLFKTKSGEIICGECLAEWCIENDVITEVWEYE